MALHTKDHGDKGVSLARVPALIIGSILLAFGLLAFLYDLTAPTGGFPDGTVQADDTVLGFAVNGWTAFFTAVGGGLLMFGAAQHLLAKTMSLVVGLALGACSVIALVDGEDVLGLAAANGPTKLGWGIAAAALLANALMPRKGGREGHGHVDHHREDLHREDRIERPVHHEEHVTAAHPVDTHRQSPVEDRVPPTGRFTRDHDRHLGDRDGLVSGERPLDERDLRDGPVTPGSDGRR